MIKQINNVDVYGNMVNGEWLYSNHTIDLYSPIDGEKLGSIQAMSEKEIDAVYVAAENAKKAWANVPTHERVSYLYKAADLLIERQNEIADVMVKEISKDYKSCISEVVRTADYIRFSADSAKNISGESIPGDLFPGYKQNKWSIVTRVPLGVVLAIAPFNYPVNLSASKIAPALAVGNTVVVKPATQGAMSTLHLVKAFIDAGVPHGVLGSITGKGSEIGDYAVLHPSVDFINFTGSSKVGQSIAQKVTMKPILMELGGKDAAIVLADANLDLAAENIVAGAYSYSGQRCTAVKRILVVDEVADELIAKIKPKVEALTVGNPHDNCTVGPLIDQKSADFVMSLVQDALDKGAKAVVEGKQEKNLIYPYLLDHVTPDMKVAWEEPFGPILPIIRVKNADEAIELANRSEYGLQSSVFTESVDHAFYVAKRLEVGAVQVNNKTERGPDHFPFLGIKSSGIGTQGIRYSIEAMSRLKAIVLNIKDEI